MATVSTNIFFVVYAENPFRRSRGLQFLTEKELTEYDAK